MQLTHHIDRVAAVLCLCAVLTGCITATGPYNAPSNQKLRIQSRTPEAYIVQAANGAEYAADAQGRVEVDVPRFQRRHTTYFLGVVKVGESYPERVTAVVLKKKGKVVHRLSLEDLKKLPNDAEGYKLLKID